MKRLDQTASPVNMQPARVSLVDKVFRALAVVGVLEIGALVVNLTAHPNAVGIAGQDLFVRVWFGLLLGPTMLLVGAVIVWRVPGNVVGRFMVLIALAGIGGQLDFDLGAPLLSSLAAEAFILYGAGIAGPSLGYLMLTFPTGRVFPPRLTPVVVILAIIKFVGVGLEIMSSPGKIRVFALAVNPLFVPALAPYQPIIAATIGLLGAALPLIWIAGAISIGLRYRTSPAHERQQIKWVVWSLGILVPAFLTMMGLVLRYGASSWQFRAAFVLGAIAETLFLAAIAIAILRHHLFDIDRLINRTLVYGSLTGIIVTIYVLVVGYLGELFHGSGSFIVSLFATGLIAVLFQPLRERVQRAANRLVYGERDDPYAVLTRLGQRLRGTLAPEAVLPAIVETVATALKLPYVAVQLNDTRDAGKAVTYGLRPDTANWGSFPLTYQGEVLGKLEVAARAPDESFTAAEERLLADIAQQAGIAAHAARLTADLQRSRERLVTAREEERRRLRRDLHDGLGPALASLTLRLDAARNLLARDSAATDALLVDLKAQTQAAIGDIRRLVYDLRPPALDELGLVSAIREHAAQLVAAGEAGSSEWPSPDRLRVSVQAPPDGLPPLSAAVEVAAYRIVLEALTNVARHARARACVIRLSLDGVENRRDDGRRGVSLRVELNDDGLGLSPGYRAGVGLTSMRERAAELGGTFAVGPAPGGGTSVVARLPLG